MKSQAIHLILYPQQTVSKIENYYNYIIFLKFTETTYILFPFSILLKSRWYTKLVITNVMMSTIFFQ